MANLHIFSLEISSVHRSLFTLGACVAAWAIGCQTPPVYESSSLPRFLVDNPPANAIAPAQELQVVPVQRAVVTLPDAVRECVLSNMKLKAGEEKVRSAQADYLSESLIPNSQLLVDGQLLPLSTLDAAHQGGPPEYDAFLTVPIDWFLFGKRVAAQSAARLNIDVAQAELADLIRKQISQTVDSFYDVLEANLALQLAERRLVAYQNLEDAAKQRRQGKEVSALNNGA
jgi:cobalt-zinc-cadmium efflux system outer membrane protein